MPSVLLIPLAGPMQSWGTRSHFQERDTEKEPTKSGVVGLLCASLGRDRSEPVDDLAALVMGVRVDREGKLRKDFQTAMDVLTADGVVSRDAQLSHRHYLADAVFLVGLEGALDLLTGIHAALKDPMWPIFLGRKAHVPSLPTYLPDGLREECSLRDALLHYPLLASADRQGQVRVLFESAEATHESRMDQPVSFAHEGRAFRRRYVHSEFVSSDVFPTEESKDVPLATHC